ncbi:MAG: DsrE/DsrF/DrsH-like family protein [Candidatus Dormibacteraeota bacterium]|nr:DsrE/DsrF/DrsH-like family protein [Candidatus Dormibacteraeota bacterium]MBO0704874.1 DsrE/DsrF/DrsH-like family protein [Candidatus Dormibacteraeota bacterium]MBO0762223.1 DsrE/DsrF/DrsH-like family protein [Candidatus Dormibacteraeota bacterium]
MSVDTGNLVTEETVRQIVREEVDRAFRKDPAAKKACIIASKGSLDWAYPPLILGSAAAAAGMDAAVFFTFYGLNIIHKDFKKRLKVNPVGNPAMPMPVPMADTFTSMPGMKDMATAMMKSKFRKKGVVEIEELLDVCRASGVRLIACAMTIEVFGFTESDFLDGVEFGGAGAFMSEARRSHVTLFI